MPIVKGQDLGGVNSLERLFQRCRVDEITGCWHWGLQTDGGVGMVWIVDPVSGDRIKCRGPRAAWILKHGKRLPNGWLAFVTCESTDCVNPDHVKVGDRFAQGAHIRKTQSQKSNVNRIAANRQIARNRATVKLSPEKAREIRLSDKTQREIAREYGISQNTVHEVRSGKAWRETVAIASIFSLGASA